MKITYSLPLNDAYWFLHQAKGLPSVPKSNQLILRYLRSSVVFSWVALEQMLDDYVAHRKFDRSSIPARLRDKLEHVLALNGKTLDSALFKTHRDLRNEITHADRLFNIADVEAGFRFCFDTISAFCPSLHVTHEDVTYA
jgi:hypothetical protein